MPVEVVASATIKSREWNIIAGMLTSSGAITYSGSDPDFVETVTVSDAKGQQVYTFTWSTNEEVPTYISGDSYGTATVYNLTYSTDGETPISWSQTVY